MTRRALLESLIEAWRAGDALRAGAHFAADAVYREARHEPLAGREAIVAHFTAFFRDGPPWELEVDDVVLEGERAALRYRFILYPRSAERRERPGCAFVAFGDGGICEWREYEG
ncbi:MAG: nuclear transport factor 2 family protein [Vulcanimicrobiaceae bacterium]